MWDNFRFRLLTDHDANKRRRVVRSFHFDLLFTFSGWQRSWNSEFVIISCLPFFFCFFFCNFLKRTSHCEITSMNSTALYSRSFYIERLFKIGYVPTIFLVCTRWSKISGMNDHICLKNANLGLEFKKCDRKIVYWVKPQSRRVLLSFNTQF